MAAQELGEAIREHALVEITLSKYVTADHALVNLQKLVVWLVWPLFSPKEDEDQ